MWLAALKIRAVPININYRYVADELAYLLDDSDCEAIVFSDDLSEHVEAVLAGRDLRCVLQVAGAGAGAVRPLIAGADRYDEIVRLADRRLR